MLSRKEIDFIKEKLSGEFELEKIFLVGSQARGDSDNNSDIDLLVLVNKIINRRNMMLKMDKALKGLEYARDIIVLTSEEYERYKNIPGTIARYASLEGQIIYAA